MNSYVKKATLTAALAIPLWLVCMSQASAYVYAVSNTDISNLNIGLFTDLGNPIIPTTYNFSATNTSTLNGVSTSNTASCAGNFTLGTTTCGGSGAVLDPLSAQLPGGTTGENNFSQVGTAVQYGRSDLLVPEAELVTLNPTQLQAIAESNLLTGTDASGNSVLQSLAHENINFTVAPGSSASLTVTFDATPFLQSLINDATAIGATSQSNMDTTFTLTQDATGGIMLWAPSGTGNTGNDCGTPLGGTAIAGATCAVALDPYNLNGGTSISTLPVSSQSYNPGTGSYSMTISGLVAGDYSVSLGTVNYANVTRTVPEPDELALLGIGLLGMGAIQLGKRKRKLVA